MITDTDGRVIALVVNAEQEAQDAEKILKEARFKRKATSDLLRARDRSKHRVEGMWSVINLIMPQGTEARDELYRKLGWD